MEVYGRYASNMFLFFGNQHTDAVPLVVMVIFSILTTYMIAATVFCLVRSFQTEQTGGVYAQLIISLLSTYGVYVLSSLLALDPWHLSVPTTCLGAEIVLQFANSCNSTIGSPACFNTFCVRRSGSMCSTFMPSQIYTISPGARRKMEWKRI